jgi:NAD(P)-dependent dehydrogenase (short-subunit alcohol dehydrogenase family)
MNMASKRTIIITGASDGIGAAAARQLSNKGEKAVIVGRSASKTKAIANELSAPFYIADFADLSQVRNLAAELDRDFESIDVLANNAGGIMGRREITVDGFEKSFQINHLAGFLLTNLLMPKLLASKAIVIQTASQAASRFGKFDISDLQNEKNYNSNVAYGNGKMANILFSRELNTRFGAQGISALSFDPGVVATSFASDTNSFMKFIFHTPILTNLVTITADESAQKNLVKLIEGIPGKDWELGGYYEKQKLSPSAPIASDDNVAKSLWDQSAAMVGI